jgi:hypothetical protein
MKEAEASQTRVFGRKASRERTFEEATDSFKSVHLRLLMAKREALAKDLMQLDFEIWALEEHFRAEKS